MDRVNEVQDSFSTALERIRYREETRALAWLVVLILSITAAVMILDNYVVKMFAVILALPLLLGHAYYYSSAAVFHRSWMKANDEVYRR